MYSPNSPENKAENAAAIHRTEDESKSSLNRNISRNVLGVNAQVGNLRQFKSIFILNCNS